MKLKEIGKYIIWPFTILAGIVAFILAFVFNAEPDENLKKEVENVKKSNKRVIDKYADYSSARKKIRKQRKAKL